MHLGSLESTQEARVALGYRLEQLLRFFRALQTSRVHTHAKHEPILNCCSRAEKGPKTFEGFMLRVETAIIRFPLRMTTQDCFQEFVP